MSGLFNFSINILILILGFAGQLQGFGGLANSLEHERVYHAVIIDAGSSGTRVLAYKFRVHLTAFSEVKLDLEDEYYEETKPGLSSYVDNPKKGAKTIVRLVKHAATKLPIPQKKKHDTPLLVRATAGLRLLPKHKAAKLIRAVAKAINKLGYDTDSKSVEIMSGSFEGIFMWYSINLLLNKMESDTVAALDLGGGSTQIAFQLNEEDTHNYPAKDQFIVPAGGKNVTLYSHSYLKLGHLAARYGIFKLESNESNTNEFTSVCVDPGVQKKKWTYMNKEYIISGAPRPDNMKPEEIYSRCLEVVIHYVMNTLDWKPKSSPRGSVTAVSYFYDIAKDAGMIDGDTGTVSVSHYKESALKACAEHDEENPWACIELVYVVSLLHDAYKIQDDDPVTLLKKVDGHEVSWALGVAYTTIIDRIASKNLL